jgi:hypothetical protein
LFTRLVLAPLEEKTALDAAAGCGGAVAATAQDGQGNPVAVWHSTWDTTEDATQYKAAVDEIRATLEKDSTTHVHPERPKEVIWIVGTDDATAAAIAARIYASPQRPHVLSADENLRLAAEQREEDRPEGQ